MLFDKFSVRSLQLANHMVMAPLTRSRAKPQHTPNALMATYYGQRATAGLIITEGTSPSPNGLGCPRIPGLYGAAQVNPAPRRLSRQFDEPQRKSPQAMRLRALYLTGPLRPKYLRLCIRPRATAPSR